MTVIGRFSILAVTLAAVSFSALVTPSGAGDRVLNGWVVRAYAVAWNDFETMGYDAENFTVHIVDRDDGLSIVFVPDVAEGEEQMFGGEGRYGAEVHYLVSREGKIVKRTYAR